MPYNPLLSRASVAETVAGWTGLGITLPKPLAKAVETFEAVKWVEIEHDFGLDLDTITAANADQVVRQLADHIVVAEDRGAPSAVFEAKNRILDKAAHRVLIEAVKAAPDAIEQLRPEFDRSAAAYTEAVDLLPDEITESALVDGGPAVVTAFADAKRAAAHLNRVSTWLVELGNLPGGRDSEFAFNVLPSTAQNDGRLRYAAGLQEQRDTSAALLALNPVFAAAVRCEFDFTIDGPADLAVIHGVA